MNEALTVYSHPPGNKGWAKKILGGAVTAAAAVLVALLAVPAAAMLCLSCLVWNLADRILDALDR